MTQADILAALKSAGYPHIKEDSKTVLIVFTDSKENRRGILEMFAATLKGRYITDKRGRGWKSSVGAVIKDNVTILCKPAAVKGAGASLGQLDARVFAKLGTPGTFEYHGKLVKVVTFTSAETLKKSILKGIADSESLTKKVGEAYEDFFAHGKFLWAPTLPAGMIDKLGVYTGELLIGWVYLAKKANVYIPNNPIQGVVKAFHLPTDPQFSGVDSFLEMKDGTYYAISSKAGLGAAASLFSNLMSIGMEDYQSMKPSFFRTMCELAVKNGFTFKDSQKIVYMTGVRAVLKLGANAIRNPSDVFTQIKSGKLGAEAKTAVLAISRAIKEGKWRKQEPTIDWDAINKKLPVSCSAFFNRAIASELMHDKVSLNQITQILAGKDYWQANLQIAQWLKGSLEFKVLRSGKADVKIIGRKTPIDNISSNQGWVNYELRYV